MDNSYIQEQHARINNSLAKFEPGSTNAMWAILKGLYTIDNKKISISKEGIIPFTEISLGDIERANECEYYIAFTQKNAATLDKKIYLRSQMFSIISFVKSELYTAYSKYIAENYASSGINFVASTNYLGGK